MKRKLVRMSDTEALKEAGIPWTFKTLEQYRQRGKYPRLFVKIGKLLMIDVTEFERTFVEPACALRDEEAAEIERAVALDPPARGRNPRRPPADAANPSSVIESAPADGKRVA